MCIDSVGVGNNSSSFRLCRSQISTFDMVHFRSNTCLQNVIVKSIEIVRNGLQRKNEDEIFDLTNLRLQRLRTMNTRWSLTEQLFVLKDEEQQRWNVDYVFNSSSSKTKNNEGETSFKIETLHLHLWLIIEMEINNDDRETKRGDSSWDRETESELRRFESVRWEKEWLCTGGLQERDIYESSKWCQFILGKILLFQSKLCWQQSAVGILEICTALLPQFHQEQ